MQEAHGALRMGCRLEDRPLVVSKNFEPRLQIGCMIRPRLELRRDTEIGAEEATAELSNKFFARAISPFLRIARPVTSDAMFPRRPVGRLMAWDGRVSGSIPEPPAGRHLGVSHPGLKID